MAQHKIAGDAKPSTGSTFKRWLPLLAIGAALASFFAFGLHRYFSIEVLRQNRQALTDWVAADPVLAVGLFILAYAAAVAISFPGASILTIFGGFLFGITIGVPAIVVGATIGAFIIFLAAKTAFADSLSKRASGFLKRMEDGFRENELSYMFLLRLVPLFPFWGVNIGAGVAGVKARNFLIGTFFGIIPGTFVYAGVGAKAGQAFDAGEDLSLGGLLLQPDTLAILAVFIILAIAPIVVKARANKKSEA